MYISQDLVFVHFVRHPYCHILRVYFTIGHIPGGALRVCLRLFMHSLRGGNGTDDIVITILVCKCLLSP